MVLPKCFQSLWIPAAAGVPAGTSQHTAQQKDKLMGGKLNWSSASHLAANLAPSVSCSGWLMSTAVQSPMLILFRAFLYPPGTWYFWSWESSLEPDTLQLSAQSTWDWQPQGFILCCSSRFWERMLCLFHFILPSYFSCDPSVWSLEWCLYI